MSIDPQYHICKDSVRPPPMFLSSRTPLHLPGNNNLSQAICTFIGINTKFIGSSPNNFVAISKKILLSKILAFRK